MLERIAFERFRILRDVDVELEPFTVVVGANSSGKTTFLKSLEALTVFLRASNVYNAESSLEIPDLKASINRKFFHFSKSSSALLRKAFQNARSEFGNCQCQFVQLETDKLETASYTTESPPRLREDGTSLASVLEHLKRSNEPAFSNILKGLRNVVPSFQDLRIEPTQLHVTDSRQFSEIPLNGFELRFDMDGARAIPAADLSSGTLLTLGMLTVLQVSDAPALLLWDDMEQGLHPNAMERMVQQIRKIQQVQSDLQIIATSHSPYMVGHFKPEEVRLTALRKDGTATIGKLTDHPDFERWDGYMDAGEFWSAVGESWLTEDDPAPVEAEAQAVTA